MKPTFTHLGRGYWQNLFSYVVVMARTTNSYLHRRAINCKFFSESPIQLTGLSSDEYHLLELFSIFTNIHTSNYYSYFRMEEYPCHPIR